jgi:membrane-associated protease RseP (regulator of RpoE activity)
MFLEPNRTPYDLNWKMFGISVRVHPWFWLVALLLGWGWRRAGFDVLLLWVGCVFVSVLVHELGHVLMGRAFGSRGNILFYGFGGLAVGSNDLRIRWQRIAVLLAGPGAGFLLYGLVMTMERAVQPDSLGRLAFFAIEFLIWINLYWGILNLLPVYPLDGGQISRELWQWILPENGARLALGLSIVVAGLLAVNALQIERTEQALPILDRIPYVNQAGGLYLALLFGMLAFYSFQALQVEGRRKPWEWEHEEW